MCGIALTLAYAARGRNQSTHSTVDANTAAESSTALASAADRWSRIAESRLRSRGPDVQRTLPMPAVEGCALHLTATVLHLRGPSSSPTAQPLVDESSGNTLCWNGELYSLNGSLLTPSLRKLNIPQIGLGQNDTAYVLSLLNILSQAAAGDQTVDSNASSSFTLAASSPAAELEFGILLTDLLAAIDGPFSFIFYRADKKQVWYGRDRLGRRSLVTAIRTMTPSECAAAPVHSSPSAATAAVHVLHVSSVALWPEQHSHDDGVRWEEVDTSGAWCVQLQPAGASPIAPSNAHAANAVSAATSVAAGAPFTVQHYAYPHVAAALSTSSATVVDASYSRVRTAHSFSRGLAPGQAVAAAFQRAEFADLAVQMRTIESMASNLSLPQALRSLPPAAQLLYDALASSMRTRIGSLCTPPSSSHAQVGILFSGGIDCMVLARMADQFLPRGEPVDLISVAFTGELRAKAVAKLVPDRVTAINGWRELRAASERDAREASSAAGAPLPSSGRQFNLILVNVSLAMLERHREEILALLHPSATVMDFNIASVLWFGARAKGRLHREEPETLAAAAATKDDVSADAQEAQRISLIQSRLSRLGGVRSSEAAAQPKDKRKGREMPPELLAKLEAIRLSPAARDNAAGAAHAALDSAPSSSPPLADDDAAAGADADSGADDDGDASLASSESSDAKKQSKSLRRAARRAERNMIRRFFKAEGSKKIRAEVEEMLPAREDYLPEDRSVWAEGDGDPSDEEVESSDSAAAAFATAQSATAKASSAFYTSHARVLLLGIGADELMAGYGRHRTTWGNAGGVVRKDRRPRLGAATAQLTPSPSPESVVPPVAVGSSESAPLSAADASAASVTPAATVSAPLSLATARAALLAELDKDFSRLWVRNLSRDDRVVASSRREARHPYLDEGFLALLHSVLPLECVADLALPAGVGDKMILRQVAAALGLEQASRLVKRAMQFGSRIANKNVAGTVSMDSSLACAQIVNPTFLRSYVATGTNKATTKPKPHTDPSQ